VYKPLVDVLDAKKPRQTITVRDGKSIVGLDVRSTPDGFRILIPRVFSPNNDGSLRAMVDGIAYALKEHVTKTGVTTRVDLIAQNVTNQKLRGVLNKLGFVDRTDVGWTTGQMVLGAIVGASAASALYFQTQLLFEIAGAMLLVFTLRQGKSSGATFSITPSPKGERRT